MRKRLQSICPDNVNFFGDSVPGRKCRAAQDARFLLCHQFGTRLPLVVLEGMSMGRAIVGSGHGAIAAVVKEGISGLHFMPGDVSDMRKKIKRLISDPELCRKLGENGRNEYLSLYTPERHYETLINSYEEVIRRRAAL